MLRFSSTSPPLCMMLMPPNIHQKPDDADGKHPADFDCRRIFYSLNSFNEDVSGATDEREDSVDERRQYFKAFVSVSSFLIFPWRLR